MRSSSLSSRLRLAPLAGLLACSVAMPAVAQDSSYSLLPYTLRGYVGLNLGRTKFDLSCGGGGRPCDDNSKLSVNLYTGGMFNDWLGLELGYLNTGKLDRAGGETSAQGVNLLLVGRVPLGSSFNLFAKGGGIYGRTKVTADALSDIPSGSKSGGGLSAAAGIGYDFSPNSGIVLQWSRNKFKFAAEGHPNVDTTQVGYVYKF